MNIKYPCQVEQCGTYERGTFTFYDRDELNAEIYRLDDGRTDVEPGKMTDAEVESWFLSERNHRLVTA